MKKNKEEILKQIDHQYVKYCEIKTQGCISIYMVCFELDSDKYLEIVIKSRCRLLKHNYVLASNYLINMRLEIEDIENIDWEMHRDRKQGAFLLESSRYKYFSELIGLKVLEVSIEDDMIWIYFEENYKLNIFSNIDFEIDQSDPECMQVLV